MKTKAMRRAENIGTIIGIVLALALRIAVSVAIIAAAVAVGIALASCDGGPMPPIVELDGTWETVVHVDTGPDNWCGNARALEFAALDLVDVVRDPAVWEPAAVALQYAQRHCSDGEVRRSWFYPAGEYRATELGLEFRWVGWVQGPTEATWTGAPGEALEWLIALNHPPVAVTLHRAR